MNSTFWLYASYYSNWACAIMIGLNLLWMIEMCVNGCIQRKELSEYVEGNWKGDLEFTSFLSLLGILFIFFPILTNKVSMEMYIFACLDFGIQCLMLVDYRKKLKKYISESWFLNSTLIGIYASALAVGTTLIFMICQKVVYDIA